MRKIIILVSFLVAFLGTKAQVNPETFPTVTPLETDNIYSQTGGVTKKFTVGAIARLARNGVNGQDSAGLGGSLTQNTSIFMGGFNYINWSVVPTIYGGTNPLGLGSGHTIGGCGKTFASSSFNDLEYTTIQTSLDTCGGELHTEIAVGNYATGLRKQLVAKYSTAQGSELFFDLTGGGTTNVAKIELNGNVFGSKTAMRIAESSPDTYDGDYFEVKNNIGTIFKIFNDRSIGIDLPSFADDASAGVGGLTIGKMYKTDGTGASPLNVAGIVMIKQ